MRLYLLAALTLLFAASTGCRSVNLCHDCGHSGGRDGMVGHHKHGGHGHHGRGGHGHHGHGGDAYAHAPNGPAGFKRPAEGREYIGPQGPPTAQVAYPYYTIRGPRDFLIDNPPSIGPY